MKVLIIDKSAIDLIKPIADKFENLTKIFISGGEGDIPSNLEKFLVKNLNYLIMVALIIQMLN